MTAGMRRLFIGLWPDEAVRAALVDHQRRWHWGGGRPMNAARLHLTLHFIGEIDVARESALRQALAGIDVARFELVLRTTERWSGGIAVLRPDAQPVLGDLHTLCAQRLLQAGIAPQTGAFTPHVTLARNAPHAASPEAFPPIAWTVSGCALIWSHDARYDIVDTYGTA
jgi:2'-5' RNA ligase